MSSCDFSSCYDDNVFTDTLIQKVNSILLPFLDSMQVISLTRRVTSISFKLNDSIKSSAHNLENRRMLMTNYSKWTHETKWGKVVVLLLLGMVIPDICHGSHGYIRGEKIVMWRNFKLLRMTDLEKSEISPHVE